MPLPMREASGRRGCGSLGAPIWWHMVAQNQSFSEVHPRKLRHLKMDLPGDSFEKHHIRLKFHLSFPGCV